MVLLQTNRKHFLGRFLRNALFAVLFSLPGIPVRAAAQSPLSIILPPQVVAGAPATLAVLDAAGRLAPDVEVGLSGAQTVRTDATGRARFTVPASPGIMTAQIASGQFTASTTVIPAPNSTFSGSGLNQKQDLQILSAPRVFSVSDRFTIEGDGFHGGADENHIFLAGQPCLVLAASPVSLVVVPGPRTPFGAVELRISVGKQQVALDSVSAISLKISAPSKALRPGVRTEMTIVAHGTTERLVLQVRNSSPDVIQLTRGNVQRVTTSGGKLNVAEIKLKCLGSGDYAVTAELILPASGARVLAARRNLVAARAIATGAWAARIDRALLQIDQNPHDTRKFRAELKRMLADKPPAELAALLRSAWEQFQTGE